MIEAIAVAFLGLCGVVMSAVIRYNGSDNNHGGSTQSHANGNGASNGNGITRREVDAIHETIRKLESESARRDEHIARIAENVSWLLGRIGGKEKQ